MSKSYMYKCNKCGEIRETTDKSNNKLCFYCNSYLDLVEDVEVLVNKTSRTHRELKRKGYIKEPTI